MLVMLALGHIQKTHMSLFLTVEQNSMLILFAYYTASRNIFIQRNGVLLIENVISIVPINSTVEIFEI